LAGTHTREPALHRIQSSPPWIPALIDWLFYKQTAFV
jgi:hypothetical protein